MAAAAPAALDCWGALEERALTEVVSTALGPPVRLAGFETTAVAYEPGSPATGALRRVAGATADGQPWSVFLKVLQHPRHWPRFGQLPGEVRQLFLDRFPWRGELVAWEPGFAEVPAGRRLPPVPLAELGDDRLAFGWRTWHVDDAWGRRLARDARASAAAARRSERPSGRQRGAGRPLAALLQPVPRSS